MVQIRGELAEKELILLQKEQELLDKEQDVLVLTEEVGGGHVLEIQHAGPTSSDRLTYRQPLCVTSAGVGTQAQGTAQQGEGEGRGGGSTGHGPLHWRSHAAIGQVQSGFRTS